jgi:hypothetical protein
VAKNPKLYASDEEINLFVDLYLDTPLLTAFEEFRILYDKTYDASFGYGGVSQKTSSALRKYNALIPKALGEQHEAFRKSMEKIDSLLEKNEVNYNLNYNNPIYHQVRKRCRDLGKATVQSEIERISIQFLMEGTIINRVKDEPVFFSDYQSIQSCAF